VIILRRRRGRFEPRYSSRSIASRAASNPGQRLRLLSLLRKRPP
jgi:hypothetical protein